MKRILVLCTGNSCRSQMAEGYLQYFAGKEVEIYSAGIETHGVNLNAIKTMKADGIDISGHTSSNINEYADVEFDYIITVCDHAKESCPYFSGKAIKLHQNFPDPAKVTGTESEIDAEFERVRNMIKDYSRNFTEVYLKTAVKTFG